MCIDGGEQSRRVEASEMIPEVRFRIPPAPCMDDPTGPACATYHDTYPALLVQRIMDHVLAWAAGCSDPVINWSPVQDRALQRPSPCPPIPCSCVAPGPARCCFINIYAARQKSRCMPRKRGRTKNK